ncbi:CaiB/BaiF CoA transferase family protein [Chloroflexota bacterium]
MNEQVLAGINVLDFGQAIAGPVSARHLGNHGAQVIHIESIMRPDMTRSTREVTPSIATNLDFRPTNGHYNTSKYSIMLNLKHPRARGVVERLICWADVVSENFSPGTMGRLGISYEDICKIKPDIIMVSCSIHGQKGPYAQLGGVDGIANAASGRTFLAGWPDRAPVTPSAAPYGDMIHPLFIAMAVVAALDYRRRTGKGQYIDASMLEVCAHSITPALLDWQSGAYSINRNGNRIPNAAPHGVFPCDGDDRWCAIAVFTDEEWKAFCHVIGDPPWTRETRFSNLNSRKENEDPLEELIAEWTKNHSSEEVMHLMQDAGVAAGVVQNAQDLIEQDPQLKEREFLVPLEHPVMGTFGHPTPPYKLLKTRAQVTTSPCLGANTHYICTEMLGMSDEEFVELIQEEVLA